MSLNMSRTVRTLLENGTTVCNSQVINDGGQENTPGLLRLSLTDRGQELTSPNQGQRQGENGLDLSGFKQRPGTQDDIDDIDDNDAVNDSGVIDYSSHSGGMANSDDSRDETGNVRQSWLSSSVELLTNGNHISGPNHHSGNQQSTSSAATSPSSSPSVQTDIPGNCQLHVDTVTNSGNGGSRILQSPVEGGGEGSSHDGGGTSNDDDEEGTYLRFSGFGSSGLKAAKGKTRSRTIFTASQLDVLEREFRRHRYINKPKRIELSKLLNIHERNVTVWFQNRRSKSKRNSDPSPPPPPKASEAQSSSLESNLRQFYSSSPPVYGTGSTLSNLLSSLPMHSYSKASDKCGGGATLGQAAALGGAPFAQAQPERVMPVAYHQLAAWAMYAAAFNNKLQAISSASQYSPPLGHTPFLKAAFSTPPGTPNFPAETDTIPINDRAKKFSEHFNE